MQSGIISVLLRPRVRLTLLVILLVGFAGIGLYVQSEAGRAAREKAAAEEANSIKRDKEQVEILRTLPSAYGGLSAHTESSALVARVGGAIATKSDAKNIRFHLLAEPTALNSFSFSTGDVFITTALLNRMQTEGQLAAVLAHGAAHTVLKHSLESIPTPPNTTPRPLWRYNAADELAADALGIKLMSQAGYHPEAMLDMMNVLVTAYRSGADVAFFITHPSADNRLGALRKGIKMLYPKGVPVELSR